MRAKSSIHAASAIPPKTRMAPGNAGRTVPATPITISAIATSHRIAVTGSTVREGGGIRAGYELA